MAASADQQCLDCGSAVAPGARFCARCGIALDVPDLLLDPLGVLESDESPTSESSNPAPGEGAESSPQTDWRVVTGIAVFAVALVLWFVVRTPVTTLDGVAEALAGPESSEGGEVDGSADGDEASFDFTVIDLDTVPAGSPVLGESTGLHLYFTSSSQVVRIDLDTAEVTVFEIDGQPAAIWDDELLVLSDQQVLAVPLDNLEGERRLVYDLPVNSSLDLPELFVTGDDRLVMTFQSFGRTSTSQTITVVDLVSGEVESWDLPPSSVSRFGLVSVSGGGTFDAVDGSFIKVFDGFAFSGGPTSGIGFSCETPDSCRLQAFDRRSGDVLDGLMFPEWDEPWFVQQVPGSERLMVIFDSSNEALGPEGVRLYDARTGMFLPDGLFADGRLVDEYLDDPQQLAVWNDRFIGLGLADAVRIQDVVNNSGWELRWSDSGSRASTRPTRLFMVQP